MAPAYLLGEETDVAMIDKDGNSTLKDIPVIDYGAIRGTQMYTFWGLMYVKQWTRMRDEFYNRLYDFVDTRKGFHGATYRRVLNSWTLP